MSLVHEVKSLFEERSGITSKHDSWEEIELNEIVQIQNGYAFKSEYFNSEGKGFPLIRIRDILNGETDTYFENDFPNEYVVRKGDLLIGMDGDFNSDLWKGNNALLNQRVCRLIPNENFMLKKLLAYGIGGYLKTINENTSATTVKHLSSKSIGEIPFPLPPLPEQQRIVAKLDTLFGHLDALKTSLDRIPQLLKDFRQKVLTQAVTGKLTEEWREGRELEEIDIAFECEADFDLHEIPESWIYSKIALIGDVKGGKRLPLGDELIAEVTVHPYIRARDLKQGTVLTDNLMYISEETHKKIQRYIVKEGDVYITIVGAKIGDAGVIPKEMNGANLTENAAKITNFKDIEGDYLSIWLRSPICQDYILKSIMSAAQGKLALTRINDLPVYLTTIEEQQEIVRCVESLFAKANQIEASYQKLKAKIEQLPQALLAKAFRGELVEQLPTDGDARDLLEQIKKFKGEGAVKVKGKKLKMEEELNLAAEPKGRYGKK